MGVKYYTHFLLPKCLYMQINVKCISLGSIENKNISNFVIRE